MDHRQLAATEHSTFVPRPFSFASQLFNCFALKDNIAFYLTALYHVFRRKAIANFFEYIANVVRKTDSKIVHSAKSGQAGHICCCLSPIIPEFLLLS